MSQPRPFEIKIDAHALEDLHARLERTRWPEAECVDDWSQGAPLAYIQELAEYWRTSYDWRARERALNAAPHFIAPAGGLDIHFIHQRSPHPEARPLIVTHGWPGSFAEFLKVLGPLTDPEAHGGEARDAFHVVCPSLPGYAFSQKPEQAGWGVERIAEAWDELMGALGYERYFAQGGDWGAAVTGAIGAQNRGRCAGIHVNMAVAAPPAEALSAPGPDDLKAFEAIQHYQEWDSGYSKQQATRPQTVGYGLTDSPVGQLAWIVEKFWAWTDCAGHPENALSRDDMLDVVSLYWLTASAASSARLYWESFGKAFSGEGGKVAIPSGYTLFPKEIIPTPKSWAETRFTDLRYFNRAERGGHFAAFEQPDLFVRELRACFGTMEL